VIPIFPLVALTVLASVQITTRTVTPVLETRAVLDMPAAAAPTDTPANTPTDTPANTPVKVRLGDADDPAIWLHPKNPSLSLVAGALKEGGLEVYDLQGQVLQSLNPEGVRYNNVDVVYSFPLGNELVDLLVASDRYLDNLAVYAIDSETRRVRDVSDPQAPLIFTPEGQVSDEETTAYGLATYQDPASGEFYAFVSRRETNQVAQLRLLGNDGVVGWKTVRTVTLPLPEGFDGDNPQVEGMVVDSELGFAYLAQEQVGIWKLAADPEGGEPVLIHPVDDDLLTADAEGLTLYFGPAGTGYLLASSQGSSTFAVFSREGENRYLGSFAVGARGGVDVTDESDGAVVLNVPLGKRFPHGLLVVHDGLNAPEVLFEDDGESENVSTNFKYVPWERVARAFSPPLRIETGSHGLR